MKIIITVGVETTDDYTPSAWGVKQAIEELLHDADSTGKVTLACVGSEAKSFFYQAEEVKPTPVAPKRTMWADLTEIAKEKFRELAEDYDTRIPMWESSIEGAIEHLVEGPLKKQAQRIYDTYVKES